MAKHDGYRPQGKAKEKAPVKAYGSAWDNARDIDTERGRTAAGFPSAGKRRSAHTQDTEKD